VSDPIDPFRAKFLANQKAANPPAPPEKPRVVSQKVSPLVDLFPHAPKAPRVFVVKGEPVPWARAGRNGSVTYTPPEVREYQRLLRDAARQAGVRPQPGPIGIDVVASWLFPRSWREAEVLGVLQRMKRDLACCGAPKLTRPDTDNTAIKGTCDALNGTAYDDDAQVWMVRAIKVWGLRSELHCRIWYGHTPPEFPSRWWDSDPFAPPAST
jgi:Holliday junction resolvase RusA-like endonuclease